MVKINSKAQMYEMLQAGKFGNTLPSWGSVAEFLASGFEFPSFGVRSKKRGGRFSTYIPKDEVAAVVDAHPEYKKHGMNISPMVPDHWRVFQGELCDYNGWKLWGSYEQTHSRESFRIAGFNSEGLVARNILKQAMWPADFASLEFLMATYPGHTVEFSCLSRPFGTHPGMNTIIWEVRNY